MSKDNTSAQRNQRDPLVKPQQLPSYAEGNLGALARDHLRASNPGLRAFCHDIDCEYFKLFISPGEAFDEPDRSEVQGVLALIGRGDHPLQRAELEFTTSPLSIFKAATGLPEDYIASTIDWALGLCQSVLVCVDHAPGRPEGEAYRILSHTQASFHCAPNQVDAWVDYLRRRIRTKQQFAVVRFEISEARS